ncbi:MAG: hypothetical protein ICV83_13460 [Cytophagales bacterium]|nr:hypothetical protein [Cytophagales bacterium]
MATKKQTSDTESTAAPKTTAANGKAGASKKPAAEKAAPPAEPVAAPVAADAPKTPAKKATAPKAPKPADESAANGAAPAKSKAKATPSAAASEPTVKVFGEVAASGDTFFLEKGSVPEGQLQLVLDKGKKQLADRLPGYGGKFVTVLGTYGKAKKTDKYPTFVVQNLASHDEIARRAYDLSHENPVTVTDNWLRAENELLNG